MSPYGKSGVDWFNELTHVDFGLAGTPSFTRLIYWLDQLPPNANVKLHGIICEGDIGTSSFAFFGKARNAIVWARRTIPLK
jgi:hypothetical protein